MKNRRVIGSGLFGQLCSASVELEVVWSNSGCYVETLSKASWNLFPCLS